jgi:hypothetical protein
VNRALAYPREFLFSTPMLPVARASETLSETRTVTEGARVVVCVSDAAESRQSPLSPVLVATQPPSYPASLQSPASLQAWRRS